MGSPDFVGKIVPSFFLYFIVTSFTGIVHECTDQ